MSINDFKALTRFSEVASFSFIYRYIFRIYLLLTKFSIFLKSMCLLIAIFLKFIFNQKENCGFIWPKTFDLLLQKHLVYSSEKRGVP